MKILFAGHKTRGVRCLRALVESTHQVVAVLAHAGGSADEDPSTSVVSAARRLGLPVLAPEDVNAPDVAAALRGFAPDLGVLAGYSPIVRPSVFEIPRLGCLNLHGGRLPQYRGSSPMNWALINGEREFTISIVQVDQGVDTGGVLLDRTFPIGRDDTIVELHRLANEAFPELLLEVIRQLETGTARPRRQDERQAAYYPLRFPDDGIVLWDLLTAEQVHNRIRALTEPYPCAFTWVQGRRVKLVRSRPAVRVWRGEPGRVYQKGPRGLLVCASDRCVWLERVVDAEQGEDLTEQINRYEKFATVRELAAAGLMTPAAR